MPHPITERINDYLGNGGLFNPEMMEQDKVRALIMDARSAVETLELERAKWERSCHEWSRREMEVRVENAKLREFYLAGRDMNDSVERFLENRDRLGDGHEAVKSRIEQMRRDRAKWKAASET